jgi:hypothetical protein
MGEWVKHNTNLDLPFFIVRIVWRDTFWIYKPAKKFSKQKAEARADSSPDPSCGREESRGEAIPFPQKNSLPHRVRSNNLDFTQDSLEPCPTNSANNKKFGKDELPTSLHAANPLYPNFCPRENSHN